MIAGLAIAAFGFWPTYLFNGMAHLVTVSLLMMVRMGRVTTRPAGSALHNMAEGLRFVRRRSIILVLLSADSAETLFGRPQALFPIIAANLGAGAAGLGLLAAAPGVGSLVGAAIIMSLGDIRYKGRVVIGALLAYCCALVVLALSPWLALAVVATFMMGACDALQATPRNGVIQLITPDEMRGRVASFQSMLTSGGPAIGQAQMGAVAAILGAPGAILIGAGLCAAVQLGLVTTSKELRSRDLGAPEPQALASGSEAGASARRDAP
jgi:predicted MFS family arabinose efflux permease